MTDKPALRARLRAARDAFAASGGSFDVPPAFREQLAEKSIVATYHPVGGEADPSGFDLAALASGGELALPHVVDRATPLRFLHWPRHAELVRGPFGLWQPHHDAAEVVPDIILTPLVGFDRAGNRLGQGAGHYDRAFATHPAAIRIGIAWSVQEIDALPVDPWDVPLHAIATEKEWIVPVDARS
ncbi:5-formyltetrahydrofolate cyclo-ligase [Sphingomonas rubra]|uniref:5-formyltetrahydrofolate cyclo-ligase n=1 Tax=Sphingomonas rubra TaxID=634430 RepID=A0A1I5RZA8_9SPHN|nr:5-formyltetrahydrofolate cyclo-ligase [Sphingomonas rubra]SFP63813.1 5-formyltetrahydrofolate cyclo-ligase [Sphingomonas rubra]